MKKTIAIVIIAIFILILSINTAFANETTNLDEKNQNQVTEVTDKMEKKKAEYTEKYSEGYWMVGYIIEEVVQPYSIPLCIAGIIAGLVFQYVMGTRRLDYKHRGFGMVIIFVTILVICQILPFVFALILLGWR